jgi:hypothetical protein
MLSHEMFQEQVLDDRRRELAQTAAVPVARRARRGGKPSFVKTVIPAITHGLLRVPAPPDPVHGGC